MSDEQPAHKKRRRLRGYHVLILALLVGIGWFGLYRRKLKSQLQARMDAIRAAGKLPDALGEVVPAYLDAVPRDPFDGAELRYKRLEKGYVVYSIGEDGSDDGGKERSKGKKQNCDETFIVER